MMSSINDVLKDKFGVTGSNIAETLSKIEPSGGGSGSGSLIVNARYEGTEEVLDKTAEEIIAALPNVTVVQQEVYDGGLFVNNYGQVVVYAYQRGTESLRYEFTVRETLGSLVRYSASVLTDYPRRSSNMPA